MSAMDIDKPLDDLIKARPKTRRGKARAPGASAASGAGTARGGARPARGGGAAAAGARGGRVPAIQQQQQQVPAQKVAAAEAFKIIVSNLPDDVEERAVRDLFVQTVGPVSTATLAYNSKGRSSGVATVIFRNKGDAQKAFDMYNNRMIDQKRPLKVEVVVDPSKVPLGSRLAPLAAPAITQPARGGGVARRGGAANKKGGRAGAKAAAAPRRPKKTQEELDAEMNDYQASAAATA